MKKYKFGLQPLLNLKEQTEDLLKTKLSHQRKLEREIEQNISEIELKKANDIKEFETSLSSTSNFYNVTSFYGYLDSLNKRIKDYELELTKIEYNIRKITKELQGASKEKKVLAKLKEKEFEEYKYEVNLEEYNENDQKNSYNYYSDNLNQ
jgi:flagellar FliJ protein